jgi:hypothetical protein
LDDADTTYKRQNSYSEEMYSITVEQVMEAVDQRLSQRAAERGIQRSSGQAAISPLQSSPQASGSSANNPFEKLAGSGR